MDSIKTRKQAHFTHIDLDQHNTIVKEIDGHTAGQIAKQYHYLHRIPPITISTGLYINNELAGILILGHSPNQFTFRMFGDQYSKRGLELNRLFVHDWAPHNSESFLISQSLKITNRNYPQYIIIVAYADPEQGHIGIVYQASNWIYTGKTRRRYSAIINGKQYHERAVSRTFGNMTNAKNIGATIIGHEPKHRYIYLLGSKKERKTLHNNLPWKPMDYPKF